MVLARVVSLAKLAATSAVWLFSSIASPVDD